MSGTDLYGFMDKFVGKYFIQMKHPFSGLLYYTSPKNTYYHWHSSMEEALVLETHEEAKRKLDELLRDFNTAAIEWLKIVTVVMQPVLVEV